MNTPQIYLVGGAVRDQRLGLPVTERDWVMVGSTPEAMLAAGYLCVGADFPVFLHPQTREEVALARTERKHGAGYRGFTVHADPNVSLTEDLQRRDLTINAIAQDAEGNLIDPYGGQRDLQDKVLRHVSAAFAEDPVRILRLARFYARFGDLGFQVAPETLALCQRMVEAGEVDALVAERVWQETRRALNTTRPDLFFDLLRQCGALKKLFPEVNALFGVAQTEKYHPEIDTGIHILMCMKMAAKLNLSEVARYAVLCHDLGKGITPPDILPRHTGHEAAGLPLVRAMSERLRVPTEHRDSALKITEWHLWAHQVPELTPENFLMLFEKLDAFRRPQRLIDFSLACEADSRGRLGFEEREYPNGQILRDKFALVQHISTQDFIAQGIQGAALGAAVRAERLRILKNR